jgi:DNA polymerase/3'-5' exonuclease PolX
VSTADPLADFPPELDAETRQAYLAWWGGQLPTEETFPEYACQRAAVRMHANRHLTEPLERLAECYALDGDAMRATAFGRALSVLRAWPRRVRSAEEIKGAMGIGPRVVTIIEELLEEHTCSRLDALMAKPHMPALLELSQLHGVGGAHAAKWFKAGYSTIQQIHDELGPAFLRTEGEAYLDLAAPACAFTEKCKPTHEGLIGLKYVRHIEHTLSRGQVEGIAALVVRAAEADLRKRGLPLDALRHDICGGYSRGKTSSNDVDVVISCMRDAGHRGLRAGILAALRGELGLRVVVIKEVGASAGYGKGGKHETLEQHDNMLLLVEYEGLFRRVDVIVPPPEQYAYAVLGW